ncbi:MAG: hypothetical protein H6765_06770 [Candidatus Peribacteria bacterium]|nr:MAG: hypothetical protein H6765_06770 [Candidatus Peribacteria bacterium]
MEKTNWLSAKKYLKRAVVLLEEENPEVLRCYGLCEYRSGNREDGIQHLSKAFKLNNFDAEIILNLIEIHVIEEKVKLANKYISHYHNSKKDLQYFEREVTYYDQKIRVFEEYLRSSEEDRA